MNCPACNEGGVKTIDTRPYVDEQENFYYVERKKHCTSCGYRFKTLEVDVDVWYARSNYGGNTGSESQEESN
jgi:transcriptional regulator NrdR family protein